MMPTCWHSGAFYETIKIDSFVKSRISPPLVGGDKGEGDITTGNSGVLTLTPTLSHQERGSFCTFYESIKHKEIYFL